MFHARASRVLRWSLRALTILILAVLVFVVTTAAFFFYTPEFVVGPSGLKLALERFLPAAEIDNWSGVELRLRRPPGLPFAKEVRLSARGFCLSYKGEAWRACGDDFTAAAVVGWKGRSGGVSGSEPWWRPRLIEIEPVIWRGGRVAIDTKRFPAQKGEDEEAEESRIFFLDRLRTEILPKWRMEGSQIQIVSFSLRTATEVLTSKFDLFTTSGIDTVIATIHEFRAMPGAQEASGVLRLRRPSQASDPVWKLFLEGQLALAERKRIRLLGDADIRGWQSVDFRLQANYQGVAALRETRLEAFYSGSRLDGIFSMKVGATGGELRALDFVNCQVDADLQRKVGGLRCGPQTVRMQLARRLIKNNSDLFILRPEFEVRLNRLDFGGERRGGDFSFDLELAHMNFIAIKMRTEGTFSQSAPEGFRYDVAGGVDLAILKFSRIVGLLRSTPYAVPAPLNVLDGPVNLRLRVHGNEQKGSLRYDVRPNLRSMYQALDLRATGRTDYALHADHPKKNRVTASTDVLVEVEDMRLSAPRFDLRAPPALKPDSRFGPLPTQRELASETGALPEAPGLDFRVRVRTLRARSIQITTNLTESPIPIEMDLIYGGEPRTVAPLEALVPARGPASVSSPPLVSRFELESSAPRKIEKDKKVTGYVVVGRTPVEIFRRRASLETLRVDLLEDGRQPVNGRVNVRYLDYEIYALLLGDAREPQIKLVSDPPLPEDQIIAVLVFGRPLGELSEDERTTVTNLDAAFTDAVLGLGSLYFLASTPIESVGYDPERKMVSAKLGIGGGTTLEIGRGNQGTTGVGLRKRFGRHWVLRSDVERLGATGERVVSAFVEWIRRF